jgi:LacI family transcriptional regulator
VEGARIATSHLLSKGVKRITFLAHGPHNESTIPHYSLRDREAGYREMMTAAGLEPHVVVTDPSRPKEILNILSGRNHPEGFVCYNDILANLLLRTAYALRMSVPDDFLVIGYDDEFLASQSVVPLTSMRIPFYRAGTEAFKFAARLVEGADPIPSRMFVPELVVRDSTSR